MYAQGGPTPDSGFKPLGESRLKKILGFEHCTLDGADLKRDDFIREKNMVTLPASKQVTSSALTFAARIRTVIQVHACEYALIGLHILSYAHPRAIHNSHVLKTTHVLLC